jgi:phage gpG-like protein
MSGRTGKWGKPEWQKAKYKTGKIIFKNQTRVNEDLTPNGQDVTIQIGSEKKKLAPGERWEFQPKDDKTLKIVAKPQLSTMHKAEATITAPQSYRDHHFDVLAGPNFRLAFRQVWGPD